MKTTIQNVIDRLIEPVGLLDETVDSLYFGDPKAVVTGIVTVFMPTQRVLEKAHKLNANLVIAHEGPFFNHKPSFDNIIENDPVYIAKKAFILESGLAIFRFHDYWHRYQPDGIMMGLLEALAWNSFVKKHQPTYSVVEVPPITLYELADYIKRKLNIAFVRVVGNEKTPCRRIGLMAGYRGGGQLTLPILEKENLDLIIYGEGPEWETPEYIRDASWQGRAKALIVLGHAESEEPGMKMLVDRIQQQFPNIPVNFIAENPVFQVL
jgi:putative NIF3 family GTP cyclohydrolase 1 type 2